MRTFTALALSAAACAVAALLAGCEPASSAPDPTVTPPTAGDQDQAVEVVTGNTWERAGVSVAVELRVQMAKESAPKRDWFDVAVNCGAPDGTTFFGAMEAQGTLGDWQPLAIGAPTVVGDIEGSKVGDGNYRVRVRFTRQDGTTTDLAFVNFR